MDGKEGQLTSLGTFHPSEPLHDSHAWPQVPPVDEEFRSNLPKRWTPLSLRWGFVVPLLAAMALVPVGLEVAFVITKARTGWHIDDQQSATTGLLHYILTIPPVAIVMILIGLWSVTDFDIKKMQPYVNLAHGNAPAETTLLLDYTSLNNLFVWIVALEHKHYLVFFSGLMALSGLGLQPLAAALFTVRDNYIEQGIRPVTGFRTMSLNPNFADMQAAASAAGFVDASVLFNLSHPNFILDGWTVSQLDTPTEFMLNGTLTANTTAIQSSAGCEQAESTSFSSSQANSVLTGSWKGCQASFVIDIDPPQQYGSTIATNCSSDAGFSPLLEHKPVMFWAYSRNDEAASLVFCQPRITAYNVEIEVDLSSNVLQNVTIQSNDVVSNNVTGAPLNGEAFNGLGFTSSIDDRFVAARSNATTSLLPAAIFRKAAVSPGGVSSLFENNGFVQQANDVYTLFLSLLANELYYLPSEEPLNASIWAIEKRLWMSALSTHLLAGILLSFAVGGAFVHYFHHKARQPVYLYQEPGSIAHAASMTSQTLPPQLLISGRGPAALEAALRNKRFRADPVTGSILLDDSSSEDQRSETKRPLLYRWSRGSSG